MKLCKDQYKKHQLLFGNDEDKKTGQAIVDQRYETLEVLKNNRKSYVTEIKINDQHYILKEFKFYTKSNRPKITHIINQTIKTPFAFKKMHFMCLFNQQSILTTRPIVSISKRYKGLTYSSVMLMHKETIIDEPSDQYYEAMKNQLYAMHQSGYLHGDPNYQNFFITERGILPVDFIPRKNWFGSIGSAFEIYKFNRGLSRADDPSLNDKLSYKIAKSYFKWHRRSKKLWYFFYK